MRILLLVPLLLGGAGVVNLGHPLPGLLEFDLLADPDGYWLGLGIPFLRTGYALIKLAWPFADDPHLIDSVEA